MMERFEATKSHGVLTPATTWTKPETLLSSQVREARHTGYVLHDSTHTKGSEGATPRTGEVDEPLLRPGNGGMGRLVGTGLSWSVEVLKQITAMVTQLCEFTKKYSSVRYTWVTFTVCGIHLKKKKKRNEEIKYQNPTAGALNPRSTDL